MTLESAFNISLGPKEIRELTRNKLKKMAAEQSAKGKDVEKEIQVLAEKTVLEPEQMFTEAMMAQPIPTEAIVKLNDSTTGTPLFIMHNITGRTPVDCLLWFISLFLFNSLIPADQYINLCKQCRSRWNGSYWVLTETPVCYNGCVQILRWKSPFQKFRGKIVR